MTTISSSREKKVLPSLLSSSRLLTFSWCIYVEFSPSVSAEVAAQTQAAILYSAASKRTELARDIQEVWRCVFRNKSATPTHARKKKNSLTDCVPSNNYNTMVNLHLKQPDKKVYGSYCRLRLCC